MSIEIKRIYLENYKLFTLKELTFSNNLCVFDGPNGYGKTSIFDAIEFLITGSISRIQESEVIAANLSYSKNCLANDADKDIRIKAEFKDNVSDRNLVIALCIPVSTGAGKQNNPKSIEQQTQSYILPTYDIPSEIWNEHLVSADAITSKRKEFFGEQNIALFKILHYIHQEDRLAYFKKSESERGKTITDLFGIEDVFKERIAARIAYITNDHGVQLLAAFKDFKDFKLSVENCEPILKHLQTSEDTINFDIANIDLIESAIAEIKESIPSNYDALAIEHGFDKIYKECFSNDICLDSITVEKLKNKAKYVENQYYASFDQVRQKLDLMKQQCNKLEPLQTQMKTYHAALKKSIDSYQKLVIKQIEIPFFLYCSRLLQSYQGGQGVLIDSNDSKIRFTAPGGEHDILYTMSSGQLSAVLLAFSLVLNKIYSGNNFKTLFIDDPIQCMDDINMISFVELLRREFADSQIVLSTHEDTFANYIKYKFSKYNIRSQSITLKTDAQ